MRALTTNYKIAVAVRATNERTLPLLVKQLSSQLSIGDVLKVFNEQEPFYIKLEKCYKWCIAENADISLIIDADILLRKNILKLIKSKFKVLPRKYSGFGIMLFDRFFQRPKFRGLHVYRTSYLPLYLYYLPQVKNSLRPESDLKNKVGNLGLVFSNDFIKFYVAGLHDYFQWYDDIFWKMVVRSKRSYDLIALDYIPKENNIENRIAYEGLRAGDKLESIVLDKTTIDNMYDFKNQIPLKLNFNVNKIIIKELLRHYGFSMFFFAANYIWIQSMMNSYLRKFTKRHYDS